MCGRRKVNLLSLVSPIDHTALLPRVAFLKMGSLQLGFQFNFVQSWHSNCTQEKASSHSSAEWVPVPLLHIQPFPACCCQGCCCCSLDLQPLLLHVYWQWGDLPRGNVPVGGGQHQGRRQPALQQHGSRSPTGEGC